MANATIDQVGMYHEDFSGALSAALNSEIIYENSLSCSSLGVRLEVPSGGQVQIQASFDGVNFFQIQFYTVDTTTLASTYSSSCDLIGSIAAFHSIKFIVTSAGIADGSVTGRASIV